MAKRGATGRGGPHPVADRRRDKSRDGEERRKRGRGAKSVELFRKRREPASQEGGGVRSHDPSFSSFKPIVEGTGGRGKRRERRGGAGHPKPKFSKT